MEYLWDRDLSYRKGVEGEVGVERCRLDVYAPVGVEGFGTVIWFHAGGMTEGEKFVPEELQEQGLGVVAVNYRLHPQVKAPAYIEDAAAAIAWVLKNIQRYGGDPAKVFATGHSAGAYLAMLVGLDRQWLAPHGLEPNALAGLVSFSGQCITHFTVRQERVIAGTTAVVDDLAPLYHVRGDAPPLLLVTGDREMEMLGRYEENAYMWRMMKEAGHERTVLHEVKGQDHGGMPVGGFPLMLEFLGEVLGEGAV